MLENKIPPPIVTVISSLIMWGISRGSPGIAIAAHWQWLLIGACLVAGAFFCLSGVWSFHQAKTTVNPLRPDSASTLVTSGVYRLSRNPMYLGFAFFLVAWAVYLSSPAALIGVAGFVFYLNRFQIVPEERAMDARFGEAFHRYALRVPRWLW